MAAQIQSLRLLSLLIIGVFAEPTPGRVPKVYNALITSNQNLEPSKAYPVYQPVIHDAFAFPFQPAIYYGSDFPIHNGIFPAAPAVTKDEASQPTPSSTTEPSAENGSSSTEALPVTSPAPEPKNSEPNTPTAVPPLPPNTQSPIPLNQFGLPPQVLPLNGLDPAYNGFTHISPFSYSYPNIRFYDPFDPFSLHPYSNFPLIRPLHNLLGQGVPIGPVKTVPIATEVTPTSTDQSAQTPPPEPSDLNVLNYSSKDPAIPDVPPPPLPQGGLKSDKTD